MTLPFTTDTELDGPWYTWAETLVSYRTPLPETGTNLARMFVRPQDDHALWVVCPVDDLVGSTMENFVERLAGKLAGLLDGRDASLLTWWPTDGDREGYLTRVRFAGTDETDGQVVYRDPVWAPAELPDGVKLPGESQADVTDYLETRRPRLEVR